MTTESFDDVVKLVNGLQDARFQHIAELLAQRMSVVDLTQYDYAYANYRHNHHTEHDIVRYGDSEGFIDRKLGVTWSPHIESSNFLNFPTGNPHIRQYNTSAGWIQMDISQVGKWTDLSFINNYPECMAAKYELVEKALSVPKDVFTTTILTGVNWVDTATGEQMSWSRPTDVVSPRPILNAPDFADIHYANDTVYDIEGFSVKVNVLGTRGRSSVSTLVIDPSNVAKDVIVRTTTIDVYRSTDDNLRRCGVHIE